MDAISTHLYLHLRPHPHFLGRALCLGASPPFAHLLPVRQPTDGFWRPRARRCRARQSFLMRPQRVAVAASGVGAGAIARTGGEGAPRALELSSLPVPCPAHNPLSRCLISLLSVVCLSSPCDLPVLSLPTCMRSPFYHHNSRQLDGMASV